MVIIKHGVSAVERERKQKKTPIFTFKKFPRPLKRVSAYRNVYKFDGETKQQSKKESVCRTVRLREWELAMNVSVY